MHKYYNVLTLVALRNAQLALGWLSEKLRDNLL